MLYGNGQSWAYHCIRSPLVWHRLLTGSENRFKFSFLLTNIVKQLTGDSIVINRSYFYGRLHNDALFTQVSAVFPLDFGFARLVISLVYSTQGASNDPSIPYNLLFVIQLPRIVSISKNWSWDHTKGPRKVQRRLLNFSS